MKKKSQFLLIAILVILVYYLPYFILGKNSPIRIHDNLDSNISWIKLLIDNHALFASPNYLIPQPLDGLTRAQVYPAYDFPLLIFKIFGVYWGYVINKLIISLVGFFGMYLLLSNYIIPNEKNMSIPIGCSLAFSLLPFWSFTATISGIPFLFFAFFNLRNKKLEFSNWLIIILFAFHSSLILSGFFVGIILILIWLRDLLKNKNINLPFTLGLLLLGVTYLVSQFPIIYSVLFDNITDSHRLEFLPEARGLRKSINLSKNIFLNGQTHSLALNLYISILTITLLILRLVKPTKKILLFLCFILAASLFFGFNYYKYFYPYSVAIFSKIPIQIERSYFLFPFLWYLILALILSALKLKSPYKAIFVSIFLIFQIGYDILNHEVLKNNTSFKQFYAEKTFEDIKNKIDLPLESVRIVSIGLHPAVSHYNGFYTLDGYFPSYSLNYKHEFRKIIERELNRDNTVKDYFDHWGSRCYAFSSELGTNYQRPKVNTIELLDFNYDQFKSMNGHYLISAVPINLATNPRLKLISKSNIMETTSSIYLYEVD